MLKMPRNPGLNEDGDTYCYLSREINTVVSLYAEVLDGRLFLRIVGMGESECVTTCIDRHEAQRLLDTLAIALPTLKTWEEISVSSDPVKELKD